MNAWQRWRASRGYPWRDRVIYAAPESCLVFLARALDSLALRLATVDEFCKRCAWRRKRYGFRAFIRRTWNQED